MPNLLNYVDIVLTSPIVNLIILKIYASKYVRFNLCTKYRTKLPLTDIVKCYYCWLIRLTGSRIDLWYLSYVKWFLSERLVCLFLFFFCLYFVSRVSLSVYNTYDCPRYTRWQDAVTGNSLPWKARISIRFTPRANVFSLVKLKCFPFRTFVYLGQN